jgi:hypothetical protein
MPTFHFYRAGQKLAELKGANPQKLEELLQKHSSGTAPSSNNGLVKEF